MCSVFQINISNCYIQLRSLVFCLTAPTEGLNSMPSAAEVSHNRSVTLRLLISQVWTFQQQSSVKWAYMFFCLLAQQELCKDPINVVIVGSKLDYRSGSMIVPSFCPQVVSLWKDDFI